MSEKTSTVSTWLVKDTHGEQVAIDSDHYQTEGQGVTFFLRGEEVAHFCAYAWMARERVHEIADITLAR
jgi:hypothetical protein